MTANRSISGNYWTDLLRISSTIRLSVCDFISRFQYGDLHVTVGDLERSEIHGFLAYRQPILISGNGWTDFRISSTIRLSVCDFISRFQYGDLHVTVGDLERSDKHIFAYWPPIGWSQETAGPIYSNFKSPIDSAYAISSAVFNMVTLGHRFDPERSD